MGFFAGCAIIALLVKAIWDFASSKKDREKIILEYRQKPRSHVFLVVQLVFFLMFFLGIFIPTVGSTRIGGLDLQVWQVGGLGFFVMWVAKSVLKIES